MNYNRVKSLRNPAVKMSKSDADRLSTILLTDSADTIRLKIRKAVSDMTPTISYDPIGRTGISNLVDIASALSGQSVDEVCWSCRQFDTVAFKNFVSDIVIERLRPVSNEITRLLEDTSYLSQVLSEGSRKATDIAASTYADVCRLIGFN